jgi:hypothetical protein
MDKQTFTRAFVIFLCGLVMAVFGCAGFLTLGRFSGPGQLFALLGSVMFIVGLLAFGGGAMLMLVQAVWWLLDVFLKASDRS